MRGTLIVIFTAFAAGSAAAADPQPSVPAVHDTKPKQVCRLESSAGSLITHRVCRSLDEEDQLKQRTQHTVDGYRDMPRFSQGGPG